MSKETIRGYTSIGERVAPVKPEILRRMAARLSVSIDELRAPRPETGNGSGEAGQALSEIERLVASGVLTTADVMKVARAASHSREHREAIEQKDRKKGK